MSKTNKTYTYRSGEKVELTKSPDEFVVRTMPDNLQDCSFKRAEQVSAASYKLTAKAGELENAMEKARKMTVAHHAYYTADTGEEFLITDRVFVTFKEAPTDEQLDAFAGRYGLVQKASYSDKDYLFQLTAHTDMNPIKLVVQLMENDSLVENAENDLNQRMRPYQFQVPVDPSYIRQWHLHSRLNDPAFDSRSSSRCEEAWLILDHFGSFDVVVGVTDDGCNLNHPDFNATGKFAGWGYFRGNRLITREDIDANPDEMYKPGANHGTACAGVIAGEVDAVLTVGAAPGCRLLPIQWESNGPFLLISDSKLLTAINYMADKVDVISNSWGSSPSNIFATIVTHRIAALATSGGRRGRGIIFLWAAGNENCPIQHTAQVDVPYDRGWRFNADGTRTWIGVSTSRQFRHNLVDIPNVMYVAALASNAQRSHYSNYGNGIAICAPTNNVHEYLRLRVTGLGITTTTGEGSGVTATFGGTSSATPLVAGVAALTISANPGLTPGQIISILKRTASKNLSMVGYPRTPPASYDPTPDWDVSPISPFNHGDFSNINDPDGTWSPWFGHGRVDAAAAVAEALQQPGGVVPEQIFRQASTPVLAIPDNHSSGVHDSIQFNDNASVGAVRVTVDITHTYIGDLRVTLIAPSGKMVILHDRAGGRTDDIKKIFDASNTPGLASLVGESLQGEWILLVQDLAAIDTGLLSRWELEITGQQDNAIRLEEMPGMTIPDNHAAGIERVLTAVGDGRIRDIAVAVDITHTYIGDLRIILVSPSGGSVVLHDRTGGREDNIIKTYTVATTPGLTVLRDQPVQGAWLLRVVDLEAKDIGKLNRWALHIEQDA